MRKIAILVFMGLLFFPIITTAKSFRKEKVTHLQQFPVRDFVVRVGVDLNETTGLLTLCCMGNVGTLTVTISQGSTIYEYDSMSVIDGQLIYYNLSSYAIGTYLLTLQLENGTIDQYELHVLDD